MKREARLLFDGVERRLSMRGPRRRTSFGFPEEAKVAVFVGRFVQKKGLGVLKALDGCAGCDLRDGGFRPYRTAGWNLPNVRLLGILKPAEIGELFRAADMMLLPSVGEGYPLVIQEAMACGLPVFVVWIARPQTPPRHDGFRLSRSCWPIPRELRDAYLRCSIVRSPW